MLDIERLTPLVTFAAAYVLASIGAIGSLVKGGATITPRLILAVFVYWGPLSVAVPMMAWESPLVGEKPIFAMAMAMLIALGIIRVPDLIAQVRRFCGLESRDEPSKPARPENPPDP